MNERKKKTNSNTFSLRDARSIDRCIARTARPVVTNLRAVVNNGDTWREVTLRRTNVFLHFNG